MIEKADKILAKYEDDNEYHFHKCDREWIMKAMVELAESEVKKLTIHDVSKSVCSAPTHILPCSHFYYRECLNKKHCNFKTVC